MANNFLKNAVFCNTSKLASSQFLASKLTDIGVIKDELTFDLSLFFPLSICVPFVKVRLRLKVNSSKCMASGPSEHEQKLVTKENLIKSNFSVQI